MTAKLRNRSDGGPATVELVTFFGAAPRHFALGQSQVRARRAA